MTRCSLFRENPRGGKIIKKTAAYDSVMKFILETVLPKGVRIGKLVVDRDGKEIVLDTPNCLTHTRMGHFPYLTPDLIEKVPHRSNGALLSSSTMYVRVILMNI